MIFSGESWTCHRIEGDVASGSICISDRESFGGGRWLTYLADYFIEKDFCETRRLMGLRHEESDSWSKYLACERDEWTGIVEREP